jgi:hypothetical protein
MTLFVRRYRAFDKGPWNGRPVRYPWYDVYHLPFPTAAPLSVDEIMRRAGVDESPAPDILEVVALLQRRGVVEIH